MSQAMGSSTGDTTGGGVATTGEASDMMSLP